MQSRILFRSPNEVASRGFSLVEIMVAILVLSIGLLGMAALMATSMRNAQSANQRTQAINLAYEIIDGIRANIPNTTRYATGNWTDPAVACAAADRPALTFNSATAIHRLEVARWASDICYTLPNGQGRITVTTTEAAATGGGVDFANYFVAVEVCWFDDRVSEEGSDCDNATAGPDTTITVSTSL
ncbi:MAG: type IV pilus modification protein PilV [Pseudomarimonas sp.]